MHKNKSDPQIHDCFVCSIKYVVTLGWFGGSMFLISRCPHSFSKSTSATFVPKKSLFIFAAILYVPLILNLAYNTGRLLEEKDKIAIAHLLIELMFSLIAISVVLTGVITYKELGRDMSKGAKIMERRFHYGICTFLTGRDVKVLQNRSRLFVLFVFGMAFFFLSHFILLDNDHPSYVIFLKFSSNLLWALPLITIGGQGYILQVIFRIYYIKCFQKVKKILIRKATNRVGFDDDSGVNFVRPEMKLEVKLVRLNYLYRSVTKIFVSFNEHINPLFTFVWLMGVTILVFSTFSMFIDRALPLKINYFVTTRNCGVFIAVIVFNVIAERFSNVVSLLFTF